MRHIYRYLPFLIFVILVACRPAPAPTPTFAEILHSPCSAPCWYGVTPGKTSKNDLIELITKFPFYQENHVIWINDKGETSQNPPDTTASSFVMIVGNSWAGITIDFIDNIVSDVSIGSIVNSSHKYNDLGFTLDDVISSYGKQPNILLSTSGCINEGCQNLIIVYPSIGVLAMVETTDLVANNGILPSLIKVLPTLPVREMIYFKNSDFENLPTSLILNSLHCDLNTDILLWQGYTTVDFSRSSSYCY
jgi:hypothetical protein